MSRVARALVWSEFLDRTRDRWVLVISVLFALLASGVSLYGKSAEATAAGLTGPSLVTLASLLVPLVGLVLSHDAIVGERERNTLGLILSLPVSRIEVVLAKVVGRGLALVLALSLGMGAAVLFAGPEEGRVLLSLLGPTLLLGLAFLSVGVLISSITTRQATAASLVVVVWFLLVFFYDLGLLTLLVATDGAVAQDAIAGLVVGNPTGLYRIQMMSELSGPAFLENLGVTAVLPGKGAIYGIWAAWILGPLALSGFALEKTKALK